METTDWQSIAAILVVAGAVIWMTVSQVRKGKHSGCGSCGCDAKHHPKE
jgi:hypothetical protein